MVLESIMAKKSKLILELVYETKKKSAARVRLLARQAADMEEEIARRLESAGEMEKAVVNVLSAASLREKEGELERAASLFRKAETMTKKKGLVRFADESATRLSAAVDAQGTPGVPGIAFIFRPIGGPMRLSGGRIQKALEKQGIFVKVQPARKVVRKTRRPGARAAGAVAR